MKPAIFIYRKPVIDADPHSAIMIFQQRGYLLPWQALPSSQRRYFAFTKDVDRIVVAYPNGPISRGNNRTCLGCGKPFAERERGDRKFAKAIDSLGRDSPKVTLPVFEEIVDSIT